MIPHSITNMALKSFALVLAVIFFPWPCLAQHDSANSDTRIIKQSQNGLPPPSSSYIGAGTMSKSAQGLPPGSSNSLGNPLLPRVNMGANIRTPGDNLYQPKQNTTHFNPGLPPGRMGANVGIPGDNMRSDIHYYVPGQNKQTSQKLNQQGQRIYKPNNGGIATYSDQNYQTQQASSARRF